MTLRPHWYFITIEACVICGRERITRERRYTPKPSDPAERCEYIEDACWGHFL